MKRVIDFYTVISNWFTLVLLTFPKFPKSSLSGK